MKCLLVISHPLKDSLNAALAETAATALRESGHEVRIRNLYEQGFQPALTPEERRSYYSEFNASGVAAETEELKWTEVLVLVFPTWWFGMPAMLKGWFDRVWIPGIAYDHAPDMGAILPRLHDLRKTVAITTLGSPWWIDRLVLWRPVRRVLKTAILRSCAPKSTLDFLSFYGCEKLTVEQVDVMKARVSAALRHI
jgi:NAD(P)H dehydrogenase (quinone)